MTRQIYACDYRGPIAVCSACGLQWSRGDDEDCPVCDAASALREGVERLAKEWESTAAVDMHHPIGVLAHCAKDLRSLLSGGEGESDGR